MAIKIVLADDHHIVREGFRMVLEVQPDFLVVGEASNGVEAVRVVEALKPDVLVLDLMMPGLNGMEVARQLRNKTRIVVLSMHNNEAYVIEALKKWCLWVCIEGCHLKRICSGRTMCSSRKTLSKCSIFR